jgi:hypothetical protein
MAARGDLDQDRRPEVQPALVVMLEAIAVFARSELRKRPFPRIQAIALLLHLDLIGARLVGDLEQLLEQAISALFSRARVHVGKVCPHCGTAKSETMPTNACQFFYSCSGCGATLRPKLGDCCVFCSYGSVPCPPIQAERSGETGAASCCGG